MDTFNMPESTQDGLTWERIVSATKPVAVIHSLSGDAQVAERAKAWVNWAARRFPGSSALQTLSRASFHEALQIWSDQFAKAEGPEPEADRSLPVRRDFLPSSGFFRAHHQLLCTEDSVRRRFEKIRAVFSPAAKILIVGDDDQLSPLLVSQGFTNVTVIDIDERLIRDLAQVQGLRARVHDLTQDPQPELIDDYELIVMDPPYSAEGIQMFWQGAWRLVRANARPRFHLYCASVCLTRDGVRQAAQQLQDRGYRLAEFVPGLCRYPYSPLTHAGFRAFFAAAAVAFGRPRFLTGPTLIPKAVSSDLWVLEG